MPSPLAREDVHPRPPQRGRGGGVPPPLARPLAAASPPGACASVLRGDGRRRWRPAPTLASPPASACGGGGCRPDGVAGGRGEVPAAAGRAVPASTLSRRPTSVKGETGTEPAAASPLRPAHSLWFPRVVWASRGAALAPVGATPAPIHRDVPTLPVLCRRRPTYPRPTGGVLHACGGPPWPPSLPKPLPPPPPLPVPAPPFLPPPTL